MTSEHVATFTDANFDAEANGESSTRYEIHHLPTLLVFRSGRVVARIVGAVHRAKLDTLLAAVI